jgi:hypothetical protein
MKVLKFIALAFTLALAVSLYLAIGEETNALFIPVCFFYASIASFALVLSFLGEQVNK